MSSYNVLDDSPGLVKMWTRGVHAEDQAKEQLRKLSGLPFIHRHIAVMPDMHMGKGSCVGAVIPTVNAIIPAACGVDIGCGVMAVRTSLTANDLPDNLQKVRSRIERMIPHGRTHHGGSRDEGAWGDIPDDVARKWNTLKDDFEVICEKHPRIAKSNNVRHLSSLGSGNHFLEVCIDTEDRVWVMLHSGSRGVGNRIGTHFISLAKKDMERWYINLPDKDLAYIPQGSTHFKDYIQAVNWAQRFAKVNRELMMDRALDAISWALRREFDHGDSVVNCHHNYIAKENHFGRDVWVTRKGAVRARRGDLGIIPGAMGRKSFIVRGKGEKESFCSCSHGAGRLMSRTKAKALFTIEDHTLATEGLECRKDEDVIDETPMSYKPIDDVMKAQSDLVEVLHTLRAVVCVKG
ncbi:RNA-splicing ligase RtcB [Candidatus Pacearchaeota archaeon]|nr:RNA-splicing ligase RtcB [Candidatus Pacearchaeota archaeon]